MTALTWDETGKRYYETGVDRGVLYVQDENGVYFNGYAWNGLTAVTESPSGAEANAQYADNIKYLNLLSAEEFGATLEAFTYPDEFAPFDGLAVPIEGITIGQQRRHTFGLSYRTRLGNDLEGSDYGYKLHLIYGCSATPSEKAYNTINDSPEPITFSWELSTVPVTVPGLKPTSIITIDATKMDPTDLSDFELILYGDTGVDPRLPLPAEVLTLFGGARTNVIPTAPTLNVSSQIVIPTVTGVTYKRADTGATVTGTVALADGVTLTIDAYANAGYVLDPFNDRSWEFTGFTP